MKSISILLAAALVVTLAATATAKSPCWMAYRKCDFQFMGRHRLNTFKLRGKADTPFTPRVVSKKRMEPMGKMKLHKLGILNTNSIRVEIVTKRGFRSITKLESTPPLRATHIKPLAIRRGKGGSGIGFQMLSKSQRDALSGKCIRVFFREFELLDRDGNVGLNVNAVSRKRNKCVVFKAM